MQTFDQLLFEPYEEGRISHEEAMKNANSRNTLRLKIKLEVERSKTTEIAPTLSRSNGLVEKSGLYS